MLTLKDYQDQFPGLSGYPYNTLVWNDPILPTEIQKNHMRKIGICPNTLFIPSVTIDNVHEQRYNFLFLNNDNYHEWENIAYQNAQLQFVNYHHHNQFSFRDGVGLEKDVVKRLVELRSPGFTLTNHGNMNAWYRQWKESNKFGLKPIFGNEFYYTDYDLDEMFEIVQKDERSEEEAAILKDISNNKTYHITILAKNKIGFKNLVQLSNKSWISYFYKFPRIDFNLLKKYSEGLIVLSGCIGGMIPSLLMEGKESKAENFAKKLKNIFNEDFYIELQSTEYEPQTDANKLLWNFANKNGYSCVVTNDVHYIEEGDHNVQQIMMLNAQKATMEDLNDPNSKVWTIEVKDLFIKDAERVKNEFLTRFSNTGMIEKNISDVLYNNMLLFSKIESFGFDTSVKLPNMQINKDVFYEMLMKGIENKKIPITKELTNRLKEEVDTIEKLGFTDYFLILKDILDHARKNYGRYVIGPGRGSAAGSLVNYVLDITDVNPMDYPMLLFERFLSPGRNDLPDIEVDISPRIRHELRDYIYNKFGHDKCCQIGNYQTIKLKMFIADVCRTLGIPFSEIIQITKKLDGYDEEVEESGIEELENVIPEIKQLFTKYPQIKTYADKLLGQTKSIGQHAAGVVISGVNLYETLPLMRTSGGEIISANTEGGDYRELAELGYIKYDLLGLTSVDLVNDCSSLIKKNYGIDLDWSKIGVDALEILDIYENLMTGNTYGVFQFASKLYVDFFKKLKPNCLDDLCAASALLRPGPLHMLMHNEYAKRKNGQVKFNIDPILEPILGPTLGILVYQEQILRICQEVAGMSKTDANIYRKLITKKERSIEAEQKRYKKIEKMRKVLKKGLEIHMDPKDADNLIDLIESFASYGFNYAHSLSYAVISLRQLWQKWFFPREFWVSILNNKPIEDYDRIIKLMIKSKVGKFDYNESIGGNKLGWQKIGEEDVVVESPILRDRQLYWYIKEDNTIVQGLSNIKGVTPESMKDFLNNMSDDNLKDWDSFVDAHIPVEKQLKKGIKIEKKWKFGKKIFLSLLYSGALDYMEGGINEKITKWNEHRNDKIPIVNTATQAEQLRKEYAGWYLGDIKILQEYRKYFKESGIIDKTIEENFVYESAECVDVFKVLSVTKSKTKNNRVYQKVKCQIGYEVYTVFLWRANHNLVDNSICVGKFTKNGDFWTLEEWEELQK